MIPDKHARKCEYWWFDCWDWLINRCLSRVGQPRIRTSQDEVAFDLHIHTIFSHCSISHPEKIIRWAAKLGLGGIGIMDHNDTAGARAALACADELKRRGVLREDFLVIPGIEVNSEAGHIGALFVQEQLPDALSPERTVQLIKEAGGLAVAVHPYHSSGIGDAVFDHAFDAVEVECGAVFGSGSVKRNRDLRRDERLSGVTKLGTSDAHYINAVGSCYSVLNMKEPTLEAARQALVNGDCTARTSMPCLRLRRLLGGIPMLQ